MSKRVPDSDDPGVEGLDFIVQTFNFHLLELLSRCIISRLARAGKLGGKARAFSYASKASITWIHKEKTLAENFADRLLDAIDIKGSPVCVGLDPVFSRLPDAIRQDSKSELDAIDRFCRGVLETIAPIVPAVKPQIAYFEVYRGKGMELYFDLVRYAKKLGLVVIGDIKRSDIGSTAQAYAAGHLDGADTPDCVTLNGYFGIDGVQPFIDICRDQGKGIFLLVRTSNPSAGQVQDFSDAAGKKFYEHMAEVVGEMGSADGLVGSRGFSSVGAVVGATWPAEAAKLRKIMDRQIFLVPGYGAQGGTGADCKPSFNEDGVGAIVNASRSVLYAHAADEYAGLADWRQAVEAAAKAMALDIFQAVKPGS